MRLREEHEEGEHQGEQPDGLGEGETQNGVVEQHLDLVGLASAGNEEVAEDGTDSEADASEGDGSEASADVVEALNLDGDGGRSTGGGDGEGSSHALGGLGGETAHHGCSS